MEIILLERHQKLGSIGNIVNVKNGYARNYLIPTNKALRATPENKRFFEIQKDQIKKDFDTKKLQAESLRKKLEGKHIILVRASGEDSRLYGSVSANDILKAMKDQLSADLPKSSVTLIDQIKYTGIYKILVTIFADVQVLIKISVARTETEAEAEIKNESAKKLQQEAEELKAKEQLAPANKADASEESLEDTLEEDYLSDEE